MPVRAKFKVQSVQDSTDADGKVFNRQVTLHPVYSDDPTHENHAFWNATPTGLITMSITNPAAFEQFEAGQEFYVDFSRADGPR